MVCECSQPFSNQISCQLLRCQQNKRQTKTCGFNFFISVIWLTFPSFVSLDLHYILKYCWQMSVSVQFVHQDVTSFDQAVLHDFFNHVCRVSSFLLELLLTITAMHLKKRSHQVMPLGSPVGKEIGFLVQYVTDTTVLNQSI